MNQSITLNSPSKNRTSKKHLIWEIFSVVIFFAIFIPAMIWAFAGLPGMIHSLWSGIHQLQALILRIREKKEVIRI